MENVFFLMWLADVIGAVGFVAVIATCAVSVCCGVLVFMAANGDENISFSRAAVILRWLTPVVLMGVFLPGKSTIQLMVVAQAANVAADSRLGTKAIEAFESVLNNVISAAKAK